MPEGMRSNYLCDTCSLSFRFINVVLNVENGEQLEVFIKKHIQSS